MNRVVIKRDGLEKNFDITCIEEAIKKAAIAADKEINDFDDIISKITNKLNKEKVTVEEIQDVIEHTLMVSKYKDVAKKFIEYRHERDLLRGGQLRHPDCRHPRRQQQHQRGCRRPRRHRQRRPEDQRQR